MGPPDASHNGHPELSLTEWVVLAVLVEAPIHGFAIAKELRPDTDLGRILTVHRPLVYRALDRLVAAGLAEPHHTEPGAAGPTRTEMMNASTLALIPQVLRARGSAGSSGCSGSPG